RRAPERGPDLGGVGLPGAGPRHRHRHHRPAAGTAGAGGDPVAPAGAQGVDPWTEGTGMTWQLAPEAAELLAGAPPRPERHTQSRAAVRRSRREAARLFAPGPDLHEVVDGSLAAPVGDIPVRLYRSGPGVDPALVYLHGGGWALGDLDTHDSICRHLARDAGCTVVSVDYRQPPEHRFPAAVDDAVAAVQAVAEQAHDLRVDPR